MKVREELYIGRTSRAPDGLRQAGGAGGMAARNRGTTGGAGDGGEGGVDGE